jgi:hypothetical protein
MAISDKDIKLLWGRASGRCSKPGCGVDLTKEVEGGDDYVIGEMAHVIARRPGGPRGRNGAGDDTYANLLLLCPTHHREVDKAPEGTFPAEMLHEWKRDHEGRIRNIGSTERFKCFDGLAAAIRMLLAENRVTWETLGPKSEVTQRSPNSNAHRMWELRRADRIVPNNRRIVNMIRANQHLLGPAQVEPFAAFVNHAEAYEENVYERLDEYPLFPQQFAQAFR